MEYFVIGRDSGLFFQYLGLLEFHYESWDENSEKHQSTDGVSGGHLASKPQHLSVDHSMPPLFH